MRKTDACAIVARRLNLQLERVTNLVQRVSEAGLLPVARGSDRPNLCSLERARLFLCAVADNGLGRAAATVNEFEALVTENGLTLGDVLSGIFRGDTDPPGDCAFQIEPASAMLTVGTNALYFGSDLQAGSAVKIIHIPAQIMRAIAFEFQNHSPKEADRLTYQTTKDELHKARGKQAHLTGELREIEKQLSVKPFDELDPQLVALRQRGRDLRDELSSLDRQVADLEPQVAALARARKAEARTLIAPAKAALDRLAGALDAVAAAANEAEQHRVALREAGGTAWKRIPAEVLALPGARKLVENAVAELDQAR